MPEATTTHNGTKPVAEADAASDTDAARLEEAVAVVAATTARIDQLDRIIAKAKAERDAAAARRAEQVAAVNAEQERHRGVLAEIGGHKSKATADYDRHNDAVKGGRVELAAARERLKRYQAIVLALSATRAPRNRGTL